MHQLVVNWDGKKTTLFIDMQAAGSVEGPMMPRKPTRLVVGQLGDGLGTNKRLEMFGTYKRPLTQGEITADEQGRAGRVIGTALDITQRKRAEEALRS